MVNALVSGWSGCGCYVFSLILELGTLVLKAGPKVLQKWGFYLIPTGTPLLRQPPPGPSGWCGAGPQADCSRLSAPRAGQHIPSCPGAHLIPARLRLLVPSLSCAWVRGGSQGSMRQPALSSFSNSSRLLPPPASGGASLLVLTFYSRRQLRDGGERGVGEKGQALADGGGSDFPHKLPSPPCLYDALLGLNKQRLLTQR